MPSFGFQSSTVHYEPCPNKKKDATPTLVCLTSSRVSKSRAAWRPKSTLKRHTKPNRRSSRAKKNVHQQIPFGSRLALVHTTHHSAKPDFMSQELFQETSILSFTVARMGRITSKPKQAVLFARGQFYHCNSVSCSLVPHVVTLNPLCFLRYPPNYSTLNGNMNIMALYTFDLDLVEWYGDSIISGSTVYFQF